MVTLPVSARTGDGNDVTPPEINLRTTAAVAAVNINAVNSVSPAALRRGGIPTDGRMDGRSLRATDHLCSRMHA